MNTRFFEWLMLLGMFIMLGTMVYFLSTGMEKLFAMPKFM